MVTGSFVVLYSCCITYECSVCSKYVKEIVQIALTDYL